MKGNSFQTDLETISRGADTSIEFSGNMSDVAFKRGTTSNSFTSIKDRITTLINAYQSPTQAVATPDLSLRLSPTDNYSKEIMTASGQLPPTATPPLVPDIPGDKPAIDDSLITKEEHNIKEPSTFAMSIIAVIVVLGLIFLIIKNK